jgi:hypothetical protein
MTSDDGKTKTKPAPKTMLCQRTRALRMQLRPRLSGEKDVDLSSGYSRGEGQKPVSKAYKENWNLIFAKKRKR